MPSLPTPPWAMEEPPLFPPQEILLPGGDAPAEPAGAMIGGAASPRTGRAEPPLAAEGAGNDIAPHVTQPLGASRVPAGEVVQAPLPDPTATWTAPAEGVGAPADADPMAEDAPPFADAPEPSDQVTMPPAEDLQPPAFDQADDDAFPTLAALDAIRAAFAEDPPGLDEAARAELAALLGLDPALAAEEAAFLDALREAPAPDGDALLAEWLSAARAAEPGAGLAPAADWPFP